MSTSDDYRRVASAIDYLRERAEQHPGLDEVAAHVGVSPHHFQRVFRRWAGVSPKRFQQYLTVERAKSLLAERRSVLDVSLSTGLSSPSRLHDLFVSTEAVTPGEYKSGGAGLAIRHGFADSPFGECLIASSERGVVALGFVGDRDAAANRLLADWPAADHERDDAAAAALARRIFDIEAGGEPVHLLLRGTNFQIRVWRALLDIAPGTVSSYGDLAARVCTPAAARAVGQAVGANPIAYLIPCHRVIRADGALGGYRWGASRKATMLGWEQARSEIGASA